MADSDDRGTRRDGSDEAPVTPDTIGASGGVKAGAAVDGGHAGKTVGRLPETPACPFCDGAETEIMNPFGSHASVATNWCRSCRCPFEMLKWR